ncbi:MAG: NAD(P)/FAD-dependent oxidoreductase [Candidatus Kerfeldbacteria bacterium]|nr:NAD(P)/FAD-dependent oxidoreductase [Candidatus Kerfeldbacteria bacterium]
MEEKTQTSIFILGAGFGGLAAALALERRLRSDPSVSITLVDREPYHLYTPLLYEICTGYAKHDTKAWERALEHGSEAAIRKILAGKKIHFIRDTIEHVDCAGRLVHLKVEGEKSFDYAILALGSQSFDFGIPGVKTYALKLKTMRDALRIRRKVVELVESITDARGKKTIIVGGGGYTGVELATELYGQTQKLLREKKLPPGALQLLIVEAANAILPGLSLRATNAARVRLARLGIQLKMNHRITDVKVDHILIDGQQTIPCDLFIWTGGVLCSEVEEIMGTCKMDTKKRMMVNEFLQVNGHEQIFAIGDNACMMDPEAKKPVPMLAQLAHKEGERAAYNLAQHFYGKLLRPFSPRVSGVVVPLGGKYAVAQVGKIVLTGFVGWTVKKIVDLRYFLTILPVRKAIGLWFRGAREYAKND